MAFLKKALKWLSAGQEPSEDKKAQGFQNGEFPAPGHFDFMFKSTFDAIEELQEKAGEVKTVNGQSPNENGNIDVSIDTNLLATKEELTTHELDSTAHGIGDKTTLKTSEKSTIVGAVNELFTSASNGKIAIANAITGKGQTASGSDTFTQLASAISNISTGKKQASGVVTLASVSATITVNNLDFTPKTVLIRQNTAPNVQHHMRLVGIYKSEPILKNTTNTADGVFGLLYYTTSTAMAIGRVSTKNPMTPNGFSLVPEDQATGTSITWEAYE